ncbi:Rmf/CrpP family protein [Mesorhizobium sp.]|uniref:Rmf/CrpP family protein n=1 Tax=Mesorhizobium sp. TaxID=1871066 RepID=UPI00338E3893
MRLAESTARHTRGPPDPRDEGIDAYCLKLPRSACPYPLLTKKRRSWLQGWDEPKGIDEEEQEAWSFLRSILRSPN